MDAPDEDWTPTDPDWVPADSVSLDRLELLDEVVHPTRGALLRRLRHPRTVADLAEVLQVPITRLYHHVNRLERDGLIRIVATRRVGGVVERRYRAVGRRFELDPDLLERSEPAALARAFGALFDVAKVSLQREFELGAVGRDSLEDATIVTLAQLHLEPARRRALVERLHEVLAEFTSEDGSAPDTEPFRLFVAAFPETP